MTGLNDRSRVGTGMMMTDLVEEKQQRIALASGQQRKASDPNVSVWVEASAGTGKTKVLSDRVLRLLLKGVAPSRILCLTYTKAAAVEMNNRIAERLSRWAVTADDDLRRELNLLLGGGADERIMAQARRLFAILLDTPGGMKIQTIHSFCQEILKRFPLEAGISPYFEVMDDRSAAEALDNIKASLLRKIEEEPDGRTAQALALITTRVSESTFPKLMNSLTENRNKIMRLLAGGSENLVAAVAARLGVNCGETAEQVAESFWTAADKGAIRALADALAKGSAADAGRGEALRLAVERRDYAAYHKVFLTDKNEPRKSIGTKAVLSACPGGQALAAQEAERLLETDRRLAAVNLFDSTRAVLYLAEDLLQGYNAYKRRHSKMDYEDLIVQTRRLLENPQVAAWVLYKLDGGIDNVLIDEAQDTSPDQWAIIRSITDEFFYGEGAKDKNSTVFAVGDRKQSIYSFQGADPAEFDRMRRHFASRNNEGAVFKEVNLEVSFRSTAAVLDAVNCVFADEAAKKGVAPQGEKVWHIPSRIGEAGRLELWPLIEPEKDENPDIWLPPVERVTAESTSSRLARMIAENIRQKVEGGEMLVSKNRPLRYRDFMVLVQRRNSFVEELVRACKNAGVSVAGADKIRLSEQIAVQDLLSLSKFVLLPEDDLTLAEVLKSPLFGLDDDDLFALCYQRGDATLWSRLRKNPKFQDAAEVLQTLLNMADQVRPFEFYSYVLNKLGGRRKFVERLGNEAEDGLDEFVNLALSFEREHIPSMQMFVDWMAQGDAEIKRELEQSQADAVRIMTVHGSKGLQAPVVILPDTVRVKAIRNEAGLLPDRDVLFYPLSSADYEENCLRIKEEEKRLSLEEYHRLLYVALTRAEEVLCICGYQRGSKPSGESWYELCKKSLEKIAEKGEAGNLTYEVRQEAPLPEAGIIKTAPKIKADFPWLRKPAPEEGPLARPLAPSREDDEEEISNSPLNEQHPEYYRRGLLIHKLLQFLPETAAAERAAAAEEYLARFGAELPENERRRICREVVSLVENPQFAPLFGENSKAEVPVMGEVAGRIVSGQIDRLAVLPDKVMIVDFKTNRPAAQTREQVPESYVRQLAAYRALVEKVYPGREVQTYILWTNTAVMMPINS